MRTCVAILAALTLASCGGTTTTVVSTPAGAQSASTPSTATTPTTTPATTATTSTTAAGPRHCVGADFALTLLGQQGATGHGELGFALLNTGSSSCRTFGYPGVLFLDKAGAALPTISTRTTHDYFGTAEEASLVVPAGVAVSFRLGVTHGINSTAGCATAYGLQVIAPDDTARLNVKIPMGAFECGTATVSPLRPGVSAYP